MTDEGPREHVANCLQILNVKHDPYIYNPLWVTIEAADLDRLRIRLNDVLRQLDAKETP